MKLVCKVMHVSRSGYYKWQKASLSNRALANKELIPLVRQIHKEMYESYGARRLSKELKEHGMACGRKRAKTLMRLAGISVKQRKRFRVTTDSKHKLPVAPNRLERQFEVSEPNRIWVSDITYVWTTQGWLYLAVVIDLYSRQIVGWSMSNFITRKLVMDALLMARWRRRPGTGLIFHSDRGSQYCSEDFQNLLKNSKMLSSMSRKGNCWDNAVAESFFSTIKKDRIFFRHYRSREEAKRDIVDYIEMFYNSKRRHSTIGYLSPREFEKRQGLAKAA